MVRTLTITLLALCGCGYETPAPGTPVDVTGRITLAGRPLRDVVVQLQPTGGTAQQAVLKIGPDGSFAGRVMAGRYSWYVAAPDASRAEAHKAVPVMKSVPPAYREASMERQVDITAGTHLDLVLN